MSVYVDANFLVRLYLEYDGSHELREKLESADVKAAWPLPVTDLLRTEVKNAIQRMVFESRQGSPFRTTPESAAAAQANFDDDLSDEVFLKRADFDLRDAEGEIDALVGRHTAAHGFRAYDVLHVAAALRLGCSRFWSHDSAAIKLARLEGLQTD